jgi:triacylglycerol esterase/lipase EstA (alpha/beta hydrolase family)
VYSHRNAIVDIVFVHGLNGNPTKTWTAKNGVYWPNQLLPASLIDAPANIIVYGYNADVTSWGGKSPSDNFVYQHAQDLVVSLTTYRRDHGAFKNPIIWVCHSLGGIIVKKALLYSHDLRDPEVEASRSIFVSTYGLIFLGTPHEGSNLATRARFLQAMIGMVPTAMLDSESVLLDALVKDNGGLQETNSHFLDIYQRFKIHMVREGRKTNLKGTLCVIPSPGRNRQEI